MTAAGRLEKTIDEILERLEVLEKKVGVSAEKTETETVKETVKEKAQKKEKKIALSTKGEEIVGE